MAWGSSTDMDLFQEWQTFLIFDDWKQYTSVKSGQVADSRWIQFTIWPLYLLDISKQPKIIIWI